MELLKIKRNFQTRIVLSITLLSYLFILGKPEVATATTHSEALAVATLSVGKVFYKRGKKIKKARARTIFYRGDIVFTQKGTLHLQVGPSAVVRLTSYSKISLEKLSEVANNRKIHIELKQGNMYGKIIKKLRKGSEFKVYSPTMVAGVRGTEFLISDNTKNKEAKGKKYDDSKIKDGVYVNEGKVAILKRETNGAYDLKNALLLKKGEKAVVQKGEDLKKDILDKFMQRKLEIFKKLEAMKESNYLLLKKQKDRNQALIRKILQRNKETKN